MRNEDGRGKKREKSHREKKSWGGHAAYVERKRARNAARPPQVFDPSLVPVTNPETGVVVYEVQGGRWIR